MKKPNRYKYDDKRLEEPTQAQRAKAYSLGAVYYELAPTGIMKMLTKTHCILLARDGSENFRAKRAWREQ